MNRSPKTYLEIPARRYRHVEDLDGIRVHHNVRSCRGRIARIAWEAYHGVDGLLGSLGEGFSAPVDVYLRRDFTAGDGFPAFFHHGDGRKRTPRPFVYARIGNLKRKREREELVFTLRHELAHAFVLQVVGREGVPRWLNEGIACCIERHTGGIWREPDPGPMPVDLARLNWPRGSFWDARSLVHGKYETSRIAVSILISQCGWRRTIAVLKAFRSRRRRRTAASVSRILREVCGITLRELQERTETALAFNTRGRPNLFPDPKDADCVVVARRQAVLLSYRPDRDDAPRLVAVAEERNRMTLIAWCRKHGIPVVERAPLARALWRSDCRIVPEDLYHATAEVLRYVYERAGRGIRGSRG